MWSIKMRIKFKIDSDNNITIIDKDQEENYVKVTQEGDDKIVIVTAPNIEVDPHAPEDPLYDDMEMME